MSRITTLAGIALSALVVHCPYKGAGPKTPVLVDLSVAAPNAGQWVTIPAAASGRFYALPIRSPPESFRLTLDVPWPSSLVVTAVDPTGPTFALPQVTGTQAGPVTGFFRVDNIDPYPTPARWKITVRVPKTFVIPFKSTFSVAIADTVGGTQSIPLSVVLDSSFTVTVKVNGPGHVTSVPPGITCGSGLTQCKFNFALPNGAPVPPVTLNPNSTQGGRFVGFSGNCSGRNVCTLMLTGTAMATTADFVVGNPGAETSCPPAPDVVGFIWRDEPSCASGNIGAHPGIGRRCDSQGYFCCEPSIGGNAPRCGGAGQLESAPDCGLNTNLMLFQPGGCYEVGP